MSKNELTDQKLNYQVLNDYETMFYGKVQSLSKNESDLVDNIKNCKAVIAEVKKMENQKM